MSEHLAILGRKALGWRTIRAAGWPSHTGSAQEYCSAPRTLSADIAGLLWWTVVEPSTGIAYIGKTCSCPPPAEYTTL